MCWGSVQSGVELHRFGGSQSALPDDGAEERAPPLAQTKNACLFHNTFIHQLTRIIFIASEKNLGFYVIFVVSSLTITLALGVVVFQNSSLLGVHIYNTASRLLQFGAVTRIDFHISSGCRNICTLLVQSFSSERCLQSDTNLVPRKRLKYDVFRVGSIPTKLLCIERMIVDVWSLMLHFPFYFQVFRSCQLQFVELTFLRVVLKYDFLYFSILSFILKNKKNIDRNNAKRSIHPIFVVKPSAQLCILY